MTRVFIFIHHVKLKGFSIHSNRKMALTKPFSPNEISNVPMLYLDKYFHKSIGIISLLQKKHSPYCIKSRGAGRYSFRGSPIPIRLVVIIRNQSVWVPLSIYWVQHKYDAIRHNCLLNASYTAQKDKINGNGKQYFRNCKAKNTLEWCRPWLQQ